MSIQGITKSNFGQYFMPVAWKFIDQAFGATAAEFGSFVKTVKTDKGAEFTLYTSGLGSAMVFNEMEAVPLDRPTELGTFRVVMEKLGLGFALSYEATEDDTALGVTRIVTRLSEGVGKGMVASDNQRAFLMLNEATTAGRVYYDGVVLASASHPTSTGATINNLTTNELSETSAKDGMINTMNLRDDRGLPTNIKVKGLVTTRENHFRAKEIFESLLSTNVATVNAAGSDTATSSVVAATNRNNKNTLQGTLGSMETVNYLSNSKAWFFHTDHPNGFVKYERKPLTKEDWAVQQNQYHVYSASQRNAFTNDDPARSVYFANPS